MKSYILITGGAGYIGSHTNKLLSKNDYKTIIIDNLSQGHKDFAKWGKFIQGDIGNKKTLKRIFNKYNVSSVIHFSACAYVGESVENPQKYYINNVKNTLTLLDTMLEHAVKYFIFSSSCATFGIPNEIPISENHPLNPISPYGRTKYIVEKILEDYDRAYRLKFTSLRYFNAAGADPEGEIGEDHNPETHLIPNIILNLLGKKKYIEIYGNDYPTPDGTCIRDYIHVNDLAEAHLYALEKLVSENKSNYYNLGSETGYSIMEIIANIEKITGKKVNYKIAYRRSGDPPILISSSEKIKRKLGWKPQYQNLDIIVKTAWEWHKRRHG